MENRVKTLKGDEKSWENKRSKFEKMFILIKYDLNE